VCVCGSSDQHPRRSFQEVMVVFVVWEDSLCSFPLQKPRDQRLGRPACHPLKDPKIYIHPNFRGHQHPHHTSSIRIRHQRSPDLVVVSV
jgi:hypothetical protein